VHQESEEVFWRKDGSSFPVEYVATPVQEDEIVVGAVVTFRDITKRKKTEHMVSEFAQNMKQANDNLFRSNKELDDFAYIVSHDLKEPIRPCTRPSQGAGIESKPRTAEPFFAKPRAKNPASTPSTPRWPESESGQSESG